MTRQTRLTFFLKKQKRKKEKKKKKGELGLFLF
jgi:hypothetical protein